MKYIVLFFFFASSINSFAQVLDDFSDQEFRKSPVWVGDTSSWEVASGVLKSFNPTPNSQFYLSTISKLIKNTEWSVLVNLQFNTSSANYVDIYLTSDSSNLKSGVKNGYFVRIGGTKDEICLYKKLNGVNSLLIDGVDGITNKSSNTVALKVSCNQDFEWNLKRNLLGLPTDYTSEGIAVDSSIKSSDWFGFLVVQSTTSFVQKHSFDNVLVKTIVKDTIPPKLVNIGLVSSVNPLKIAFDEEVDAIWIDSVGAIQMFDLLGNELIISKIEKDSAKFFGYNLFLMDEAIQEAIYIIRLHNAKDKSGNVSKGNISMKLVYQKPIIATFKQIVFTEFMTDPVPSVGLPEKEYIEIHNNTTKPFDLKDYVLSDPATSVILPNYILEANQYVTLCRIADTADFSPFGKILGLITMPTLNNSGDVISLFNNKGELVDKVSYKLAWFKDAQKDDGGYSLELIDPTNVCLDSENWKASVSSNGGTPSKINSVSAVLKDTIAPVVISVNVFSETIIEVMFSENVDSSLFKKSNISISPTIEIQSLIWKADSLWNIRLILANKLPKGQEFQLTFSELRDCAGNQNKNSSTSFVLPENAAIGDILINELLFNPLPYGADFVELYNKSDRILDLKGWYLANLNNDTIANKKLIFKNSFLLKPKEYLVLTADKNNIINTYSKAVADRILEISSLPTYYDDLGNVVLLAPDSKVIDQLDYTDDMHSVLISKKEGVSIEKINPDLKTNDPNNWTSASKDAGFATPGYANSQFIPLGITGDDVSIEPQLITPNGDGDKDFMLISIRSDKLGALRNIIIFDVMGRDVKRLLKNGYSGSNTFVQWDGTDETNNPLPIGHYIIWLEAIDKSGNVVHYKKKVVVGARF
jgi:hypothetical protein